MSGPASDFGWTNLLYLAALLFSLCGLGTLDRRRNLALFVQPVRTLATLVVAVLVFIVWDVAGILLGIFGKGETAYMTGILLGPDFPIEEIFFLLLLNYSALVAWRLVATRGGSAEAERAS